MCCIFQTQPAKAPGLTGMLEVLKVKREGDGEEEKWHISQPSSWVVLKQPTKMAGTWPDLKAYGDARKDRQQIHYASQEIVFIWTDIIDSLRMFKWPSSMALSDVFYRTCEINNS